MKNILLILALSLAASTASAQYVDDLYGTPPPSKKKSKSSTTVQSTQSTSSKQKTYTGSGEYSYSDAGQAVKSASASDAPKELITSYDEALQRRLSAMRNATYDQPESYWKLMEQYQSMLEKKYNQNLYNIVVVGDEMWVEPKSITAQFDGSDPAEGVIKYNEELRSELKGTYKKESYSASDNSSSNVTIQLVVDPFDFWGYNSFYDPFYSPFYSPFYWGSFYSPWYNPWYNPFWGPSYYYRPYWGGYYPHYHGGYYGNPRGTYYGNSRYSNNSSFYRPSSSSSSRPNRSEGASGMGGTRRPNGSNTVYGGGGRPSSSAGGVSTARPNVSRPNGAPSYDVSGRPNSRPSSVGGTTTRPSSTSRPNVERPTYNRNETTYERPSTTSRPSSVSRPESTTSRPASVSRPSGGGGGGGVSRPSGGGRGR